MSSSKHKQNRHTQNSSTHPPQKTVDIIPLSKIADSFEESQFLYLQYIIDRLAAGIVESLNDTEKAEPSAMLPQLRVYAQYMNLYMKFKDKCIDLDPPNSKQPNPNQTSQARSETKTGQPVHNQKNLNRTNTVMHSANNPTSPNRLHPQEPQSALLMNPENKAMEKVKRE